MEDKNKQEVNTTRCFTIDGKLDPTTAYIKLVSSSQTVVQQTTYDAQGEARTTVYSERSGNNLTSIFLAGYTSFLYASLPLVQKGPVLMTATNRVLIFPTFAWVVNECFRATDPETRRKWHVEPIVDYAEFMTAGLINVAAAGFLAAVKRGRATTRFVLHGKEIWPREGPLFGSRWSEMLFAWAPLFFLFSIPIYPALRAGELKLKVKYLGTEVESFRVDDTYY